MHNRLEPPDSHRALVFLRVDSKIEKMLKKEILNIEGVKEAHYIYGPYDMYVELEVDELEKLQNIVFEKIRNLYGIVSTTTCYVAE
jgi:DNA-binding Lrp family transcriptional regulator